MSTIINRKKVNSEKAVTNTVHKQFRQTCLSVLITLFAKKAKPWVVMTIPSNTSDRIYRLDRFTVPKQACEEFISKVKETHELLRNQPGFIQDFLLEQPAINQEVTLVTLAEWQDIKAVENAR